MKSDNDFFKTSLEVEISDVIFKHHMQSQNIINIILISTQWIAMIIGIVVKVYGFNISKYTAVYSLSICILIMINIFVHEKTWKNAKETQHNKIDKMLDIIISDATDTEKQYKLNQLLGLCTIYDRKEFWEFISVKEADDNLTQLKSNWVLNARHNIATGIKDSNGIEYHTGDIVYNPSFGDYWLVEEISKDKMKEYGADIPFIFTLYGNPDEYAMCINEPEGFTIEARVSDFAYVNMLSRFVRIYKAHREEEAEWEKEAKKGEMKNENTKTKKVNKQKADA